MKKLLFFAACTAIFASCTSKKPYTITGEVDPSMNGKTVYLYDFHNARMTDSVVVAEGRFSFSGTMAGDSLRRVALDRNYVDVIVEGGDYTVDLAARTAAGSKLTEEKGRFDAQYDSIRGAFYERYRALMADASLSEETREEKADALVGEINEALGEAARPVVEANNNALGAYVFWRWSSDLETPEEFDAALALAGDYVRNFAPVKKSIATNEALKKTAEGMPFVDFTIENGNADGTAVSLSDYVGKGKYVLVDFWASWCGPCMGEVPYLVDTYDKYHKKGFEIYGVSFDSDRDAWLKAIENKKMNWIQVSSLKAWDSQARADYAINSIPANFLVDCATGKIIAKGLRGEDLQKKIAELLD